MQTYHDERVDILYVWWLQIDVVCDLNWHSRNDNVQDDEMMCKEKEAKQFKNATMMLNVTQNKTSLQIK